jgi:hypothetical protein
VFLSGDRDDVFEFGERHGRIVALTERSGGSDNFPSGKAMTADCCQNAVSSSFGGKSGFSPGKSCVSSYVINSNWFELAVRAEPVEALL